MADLTEGLETIAQKIRDSLTAKHEAREIALRLCREIIRHSANAIRAVHRGEYAEAHSFLDQIGALVMRLTQALAPHPDLFHGGFVHDATKEFAEAHITLALVEGRPLPDPDALGVAYPAYLNGLGEAVGELRRYLLDAIRHGEVARCEEVMRAMDDMYNLLITMDYPDAMTGGLRRTTDVVRGVLEKTRGDLTLSLRQRELEAHLSAFQDRFQA